MPSEPRQGATVAAQGDSDLAVGASAQSGASAGWLTELSGPVLDAAGVPCAICHGLQGEGDMLLCDRCPRAFHLECAQDAGHP